MLDIFSGLRLVVKRRTINIDNAIFRCHWFFTSTLLISFSLVITARQYVGQPIECHSVNKLPDSLLNSYCWVQSTFTVPQACNSNSYSNNQPGIDVPYPCIDNTRGREIKMFAYYQWVGIVLFIQGLMFHLPYYLWKIWENGLIKAITGGLRVAVLNDQERNKKKEIVVDYIHDHLGCHKRYAFKYFLCEFICLINLLLQLWATNKFFDGQFLRYGIDVINYSSDTISGQFGFISSSSISTLINDNSSSIFQSDNQIKSKSKNAFQQQQQKRQVTQQVDPMTYIFPRITKCTYYDFGSSGDIQKHDALCLLPLNIINEKIYIALWFWFIILGLLTLLVIFYRFFAVISENVRCKGLISRCKLSCERDIRIICRHCDVGDWFLFYMVAENLDPLIMREIIATIATKIRAHFELKRELGISVREDSLDSSSRPEEESLLFKYPRGFGDRRSSQYSYFFDHEPPPHLPVISSSRRNSATILQQPSAPLMSAPPINQRNQSNQQDVESLPLTKRVKRSIYNKRLWSMDLGTIVSGIIPGSRRSSTVVVGSSKQQEQQHQDHNNHLSQLAHRVPLARQTNNNNNNNNNNNGDQTAQVSVHQLNVISSAPPPFQMALNSANPCRRRTTSLTRSTSNHSSNSYILEMQTISTSSSSLSTRLLAAEQALVAGDNFNQNRAHNGQQMPAYSISGGVSHLHRRYSSQANGPNQVKNSFDSGVSWSSSWSSSPNDYSPTNSSLCSETRPKLLRQLSVRSQPDKNNHNHRSGGGSVPLPDNGDNGLDV